MHGAKYHVNDHLLSPRREVRRTFGGMAGSFSAGLLATGAYLIREQLANPLNSHPAGLLFAAVLIATALVLLSYIIHPGGTRQHRHTAVEQMEPAGRVIEVQPERTRKTPEASAEVPLRGRYVDPARIRL